MNVLFTNIGRRGYLVDFLKNTKSFHGKVYVSDCDPTASGLYCQHDGKFLMRKPVENEEAYMSDLLRICQANEIRLVIPVIDPEVYIFSTYRDEFIAQGILLLASDRKVLDICYNKKLMNEFLISIGFLIPRSFYSIPEFDDAYKNEIVNYPLFIKPIFGSGSVNSYKIENYEQLVAQFKKDMIIQEFIDGKEYGVDAFTDRNGDAVRIIVKRKIAMRSGETDKAITISDDRILVKVKNLVSCLKPFGPIDIDILENSGKLYFIDLNPRFGGGYPASHMSGINFLELALATESGKTIQPEFDNYQVGQLTMKDIGIRTVILDNEGVVF